MSNNFLSHISITQHEHKKFVLNEPLTFNDEKYGEITVPAGFEFDGVSDEALLKISSVLWVLGLIATFFFGMGAILGTVSSVLVSLYAYLAGYGFAASCVHDYLYRGVYAPAISRKEADGVFYRALKYGEREFILRCILFYLGVRIGGHSSYNKYKEAA